MKRLMCAVASVMLLTSCKEPAPVYFNRPIGKVLSAFEESIRDVYFDLNDLVVRGWDSLDESIDFEKFSEKMEPVEDSTQVVEEKETPPQEDVPDTTRSTGDSASTDKGQELNDSVQVEPEESLSLNLNRMTFETVSDSLEALVDDAMFYVFEFTENAFRIFTMDSSENVQGHTLIQLSDTLMLTVYHDRYFLNFKTEFGWEIVQIQQFEGFLFLKAFGQAMLDPDYHSSRDRRSLEEAASAYYRGLGAIFNEVGEVVGFKARLNKKRLLHTFDEMEEPWLILMGLGIE